ncbi:MAG: serine protease [bacterium]|nr:serine protease [bacterium]
MTIVARSFLLLASVGVLFSLAGTTSVRAASYPPELQAAVRVDCDGRQGSGTVISGEGYVLTAGHVAMDVLTQVVAPACRVGFMDLATGEPKIFYRATIEKIVFNESKNRDFAILKIEEPLGQTTIARPFPFLKTNEFPSVGDRIYLYGFSYGGKTIVPRGGVIQRFEHGFIETDAEISPGDSGGSALDQRDRLIGIPARIVTITDENNNLTATYELEDIRAVMIWLDTFGPNEHDIYFAHDDFTRYHQNAVFIQNADLDCQYVARTQLSSTVYCLMRNGQRMVFPNNATFFSWFPDWKEVTFASPESITEYPLNRNVTFKPGTLVKSATMNQVYVVADSFGTLRWVPSEQKAIQLWGTGWAGLVNDIPDEFWVNYSIGQPLDI